MNKIGASIAILGGISQIVFAILAIMNIGHFTKPLFEGLGKTIVESISIALGVFTLFIGIGAWKKARGFSTILLLGIFVANVVILIMNGWSHSGQLPLLIVYGIGAISLVIGMFTAKR